MSVLASLLLAVTPQIDSRALAAELWLSPQCSSNTLTLVWNGGVGIKLQQATNLIDPIWQDVPGSEGVSSIQLPMTDPMAAFRLLDAGATATATVTAGAGIVTNGVVEFEMVQGGNDMFGVDVDSGLPGWYEFKAFLVVTNTSEFVQTNVGIWVDVTYNTDGDNSWTQSNGSAFGRNQFATLGEYAGIEVWSMNIAQEANGSISTYTMRAPMTIHKTTSDSINYQWSFAPMSGPSPGEWVRGKAYFIVNRLGD